MDSGVHDQCGYGLIRLFKPPEFFSDRYDDPDFLVNKSEVLAKKQRNRGQDGAGFSSMIFDPQPDEPSIFTDKSLPPDSVDKLFQEEINPEDHRKSSIGVVHVRYGIHDGYRYDNLHPVTRHDDIRNRTLVIAGNCNFANNDEQRDFLRSKGKHPTSQWDMQTLSTLLGHFINEEYWQQGRDPTKPIDMRAVMERAVRYMDGGYVLTGFLGSGDAFVIQDPNGIRPNCYAYDDEVFVSASEDTALRAAFPFGPDEIRRVGPGEILTVSKEGEVNVERYAKGRNKFCMFEDVYFSRDSTTGVHRKRKKLGKSLRLPVIEIISGYRSNCISYMPNTSETSAIGLYKGIHEVMSVEAAKRIIEMHDSGTLDIDKLMEIMREGPSYDRGVLKDEAKRTFIAPRPGRGRMVKRGYDPISDVLAKYDLITKVEDSIVKGTTLENTAIPTLINGGAKNLLIVSSCPQIRYPCCYGIDMSALDELIAYRAMIQLIVEKGKSGMIEDVYNEYLRMGEIERPPNLVAELYGECEYDEVSGMVARMISPVGTDWDGKIMVIYQTMEGLYEALGKEIDDACLTGDFPTDGGYRVLRRAFLNAFEGKSGRSY